MTPSSPREQKRDSSVVGRKGEEALRFGFFFFSGAAPPGQAAFSGRVAKNQLLF